MTNSTNVKQWEKSKLMGLFLGPILFCLIYFIAEIEGVEDSGIKTIAVLVLMLTWWITEPIPVPVTSLLPIVLFPLLGVFGIKEATAPYSSPPVYLFLGGFILAEAITKWKLHVRIALNIVKITGTSASGIIGGFMIATCFISCWMSNTATAVMMLPIGLSLIQLFQKVNKSEIENKNFATALILSIASSANIGGIGTIIGTPTNGIFIAFIRETYGIEVSFLEWSMYAVPLMILLMCANWFILVKYLFPTKTSNIEGSVQVIQDELNSLGKISRGEMLTAIVFFTTIMLWIFGGVINSLIPSIKISDEVVAIGASIAFFLIPTDLKQGKFLLDWNTASKLNWGILLLFGGGLCVASAITKTGLVQYIGMQISSIEGITLGIAVSLVVIITTIATIFIGNMVLASMLLPVIGSVAVGFGMHPLYLTMPLTISASMSFLLPMSTPPNAVIFSSGYVKIIDMIKSGFWLKLFSIILLILLSTYLIDNVIVTDLTHLIKK